MATISSTGAWTTITGLLTTGNGQASLEGLAPVTAGNSAFNMNRPMTLGLNLESLKTQDGVILPELEQFIQLLANGYGLNFWSAAALAEILMRAMRERATPMQLGDASGPRYYQP